METTLSTKQDHLKKKILEALHDVKDPEIPTLSVIDLGIIVDVEVDDENNTQITMTPTFSGCPALNILKEQIRVRASKVEGVKNSEVKISYETSWNTDMISEVGRRKLKEFGIAPPKCYSTDINTALFENVECPYCGSTNTTFYSPFGPTLCRSVHYCNDCQQQFDQFKPVS